jgi:anti-anti-sigma factor
MNEGVLELDGRLNFNNVVSVWKKSLDMLLPLPVMIIDLKKLHQCDSSGLALLTAALRMARAKKKKIKFLNMPPFLKALAQVSGLNGLLSES